LPTLEIRPARAAFAQQAAEDWRIFLAHCGRELCPGGKLVVLTMAVDEAGNFGYRALLEAMYAALVNMVEEGFVHAEEARRMVIPTVGRSRSDLVARFTESGCFGGLSIEELSPDYTRTAACPYFSFTTSLISIVLLSMREWVSIFRDNTQKKSLTSSVSVLPIW
jgi:hypothetical protein